MGRNVCSSLLRRLHVGSAQRRWIPTATNGGLSLLLGARMTSSIGRNKDGFIQMEEGDHLLFFNNLLPRPLWVSILLRVPVKKKLRPLLQEFWSWRAPTLREFLVADCIPRSLQNGLFLTKEVITRTRDGGTFVRYSSTDVERAKREIERHLKKKPVKVGYLFKHVQAFPVLGKPWLEDIMDHFPSKKLRVQFVGDGFLNERDIFSLFRRYGKIRDIAPPSDDPKHLWLPKFITVRFRNIRGATAAKNCIDGHIVNCERTNGKVQLTVRYGPKWRTRSIEAQWAIDWMLKNKRWAALVVLATIVLLVAIVDKIINVIAEEKIYLFATNSDESAKLSTPEAEVEMRELKSELRTKAVGVLGSPHGRLKLIKDHVLENREVLIVDCKPVFDSSNESAFVDAFSRQVGYRPFQAIFRRLIHAMLHRFEMYTEEATRTPENEFDIVLQDLRERLKGTALKHKSGDIGDREYLAQTPDARPLVVFDNFAHKRDVYNGFHEKILKWSTDLVTDCYGGVILLSSDKSFVEPFEHERFHIIHLSDISFPGRTKYEVSSPAILKRYLLPSRPNHSWTSPQAWYCIQGLSSGGVLQYDAVLLSEPFASCADGASALSQLEEEGLIAITTDPRSGRPHKITARTRPLVDAFKKLVQDEKLDTQIAVQQHAAAREKETAEIREWEEELRRLAGAKRQPETRESYLLRKVAEAQQRITLHERKMEEAERKLKI